MDPTATLDNPLSALTCGDRDAAIEAAENLTEWMKKDGFLPPVQYVPDNKAGITYTI